MTTWAVWFVAATMILAYFDGFALVTKSTDERVAI
jgi:hypothetical protein